MSARRARGGSLTARIVLAEFAVVAAMSVTVVVAASLVAPPVFDDHMRQAGHDSPVLLLHAQEAFRSAGLAAMTAGLVIAGLGTVAAALVLTRVIGRGLDALAQGAHRVAGGRYDEPVRLPNPSVPELEQVAGAFNAMADRIEQTETTRRRLLTDLGHELRTPLAVIDVTLEGIEDGVVRLDAATMSTLRLQTQRLERLAHDIREVSAAEEGRLTVEPRPTSVATLVTAARSAAETQYADTGVGLETDVVPDVVLADPERIGQALDNLLRNALQHTPSGGRVVVSVRPGEDTVDIVVADTGVGIAAEHLPHLFERFYRADPGRRHDVAGGTGVGLAIAAAVVRAHRGHLTARSEGVGCGAEFVLTLPRP